MALHSQYTDLHERIVAASDAVRHAREAAPASKSDPIHIALFEASLLLLEAGTRLTGQWADEPSAS